MQILQSTVPLWIFNIIIVLFVALFGGIHPFLLSALPVFSSFLLVSTVWSLPTATFNLSGTGKNTLKQAFTLGFFIPTVLVLLWAMFQLAPLTEGSTYSAPSWNLVLGAPWTPISINPGLTLLHLGVIGGYLAFTASTLFLAAKYPRPLLKTIAVVITAASFYGIFIFATGNHTVLWLSKTSYQESLTATFINRNSFATLAGLGILANLGLMLQRVGEISGRLNTRERWQAFSTLVLQQGYPWLVAAIICFAALILTSSRAGITASLVGVIVFLASLALMRRAARWPLVSIIVIAAVLGSGLLLLLGEGLGNRLTRLSQDAEARDDIYTLTEQLISQNPITGTGLGTFPDAFSPLRTPEFYITMRHGIEHAHNTYLELTAELGYPGIALLGLAVVAAIAACLYGLKTRRRAITWPALGLAAMALTGGHALADFSFSIPAVTLVCLTMVTLAMANSVPVPGNQPAETTIKESTRLFLTIAAALLAIFGAWQAAAAYYALRAEPTLNQIEAGQTPATPDILKAETDLQTCLAINPHHPTCRFDLARLALTRAAGSLTGNQKNEGLALLEQAKADYLQALAGAPSNPHAWFFLTRIESFLGNGQMASLDLANSLLTGPNEPKLALMRIPTMLGLMKDSSPENQTLFRTNISGLWQSVPWDTAEYMKQYPTLLPAFATVIGNSATTQADWKRFLGTPFPNAPEAPKTEQVKTAE